MAAGIALTAGLLFSVMHGAGFAARIGWGWVSDRWLSARPLLAVLGVGTIASTAAAMGFSDAWPLAVLAVASAALGLTAVGWNGVYLAEVSRAVPMDKVGLAAGGVLMFTFVGVVLGPSTFGAIVAMTGSFTAAFIAMDVLVLATVVALVIPPGTRGETKGNDELPAEPRRQLQDLVARCNRHVDGGRRALDARRVGRDAHPAPGMYSTHPARPTSA